MAGIRRKSKQAFVLCGAAAVGKTVAAFWFTSAFCSDSTNERGQSPALSRLSSAPSAKAFALRPCSLDLSNVLSRTFGILLILSCQRRLLLPFLLKLQYFLKRTYYNLCFAVIIQFSRYVLVMSLKARSPETLIFITWWAKMDSNHRPHDYQSCALAS